jgi:hypothetical protein
MQAFRKTPSLVFLLLAILIGGYIRLAQVAGAPFPLNDGGLFYTMICDLQANHYSLPVFTTYNAAQIPFAYPPLSFYLAGFLSDVFRWPLLDMLRWLPALVSTLAIPAFYLLAKEMLRSQSLAALAAFIFALLPRAFDWLIMGGGITRSPGFLFALLALCQIHRLYTHLNARNAVFAAILSTMTVLTHPEAALHVALGALIFFLFLGRNLKGLIYSLAIAAGVLVLSAPWWGHVVAAAGFSPFLAVLDAARQNSVNLLTRILILLRFQFTDEPYMTLMACLGALGLFACLASRKYLLPVWLVAAQIAEPRSAPLYIMIQVALLGAIGLDSVIFPKLMDLEHKWRKASSPDTFAGDWTAALLDSRIIRILFAFLLAFGAMSAYTISWQVSRAWTLQESDLQALAWIEENIPPGNNFLVITNADPLLDPTSDWFPALTRQVDSAGVFGYEWIHDGRFGERIARYSRLQTCIYQDTACLEAWANETQAEFDFVYVRLLRQDESGKSIAVNYPLASSLGASPGYETVYNNSGITIFAHK